MSVFVSAHVCSRDLLEQICEQLHASLQPTAKCASSMEVHNSSAQSSAALHCEKAGFTLQEPLFVGRWAAYILLC